MTMKKKIVHTTKEDKYTTRVKTKLVIVFSHLYIIITPYHKKRQSGGDGYLVNFCCDDAIIYF